MGKPVSGQSSAPYYALVDVTGESHDSSLSPHRGFWRRFFSGSKPSHDKAAKGLDEKTARVATEMSIFPSTDRANPIPLTSEDISRVPVERSAGQSMSPAAAAESSSPPTPPPPEGFLHKLLNSPVPSAAAVAAFSTWLAFSIKDKGQFNIPAFLVGFFGQDLADNLAKLFDGPLAKYGPIFKILQKSEDAASIPVISLLINVIIAYTWAGNEYDRGHPDTEIGIQTGAIASTGVLTGAEVRRVFDQFGTSKEDSELKGRSAASFHEQVDAVMEALKKDPLLKELLAQSHLQDASSDSSSSAAGSSSAFSAEDVTRLLSSIEFEEAVKKIDAKLKEGDTSDLKSHLEMYIPIIFLTGAIAASSLLFPKNFSYMPIDVAALLVGSIPGGLGHEAISIGFEKVLKHFDGHLTTIKIIKCLRGLWSIKNKFIGSPLLPIESNNPLANLILGLFWGDSMRESFLKEKEQDRYEAIQGLVHKELDKVKDELQRLCDKDPNWIERKLMKKALKKITGNGKSWEKGILAAVGIALLVAYPLINRFACPPGADSKADTRTALTVSISTFCSYFVSMGLSKGTDYSSPKVLKIVKFLFIQAFPAIFGTMYLRNDVFKKYAQNPGLVENTGEVASELCVATAFLGASIGPSTFTTLNRPDIINGVVLKLALALLTFDFGADWKRVQDGHISAGD